MRMRINLKKLRGNIKMSRLSMACIFMIIMLTGACATGTKQTMSKTNITGQKTADSEVQYSNLTGDNEIECRMRIATGSIFRKKVCLTKAAWAIVDEKNRKRTDRFHRDVNSKESVNNLPTGSDAAVMGQMPR